MPVTVNNLPRTFVERLERIVGSECQGPVLDSMAGPKRRAFWVNPLRTGSVPPGDPIPDLPGVRVAAQPDLTRHPGVVAGVAYPMNPASVTAALAVGAEPGMEVLDLAAAPGGKTLVLAGRMANAGRLAAVEVVPGRFHRMRANLERCGVDIVQAYLRDGREVGSLVPERFQRALVDAPCSSEGRFRLSDPSTFARWSERKVRESARKQKGLIRSAYRALRAGGEMVYCTCTFAPEENEQVVDHLLRRHPEAVVLPVPVSQTAHTRPGLREFDGRTFDARVTDAVRIMPDGLWDTFFVCRIAKPRQR